ncbi:hypothetical protein Tco_0664257 [Tanacetum coccineum]
MKGQDNPLIPNPHPHLLNSIIKKPIIVSSSYQHKKTYKPRKAIRTTEISQSSGPINLVADETVYKVWEDRMERAATTTSSLDADQDNGSGPRCQDTILGGANGQTRFETASKQSNDPPLLRGYTLRSGEDNMKLLELMELCTKLSDLIQALVDKKKVIITESSIRSDLHLEDADGTDCFPTATILEELARMGAKTTAWNEFSSTMASAIICLAINQKFNLSKYIFDAMLGDMSHHKNIYVNPSHTKKIFANMKREGKHFSRRVTTLFATMMVQANQEEGVDSGIPTASQQTPITIQPSTSKTHKKQSRGKQKKTIAVPHPSDSTADVPNEESVPIYSNDPLLSGKDRLKLIDLMDMCSKLSKRVLDLEHTKTAQAQEIINLKLRVKNLEKKIRSDDVEMFDTYALVGNEVFAENDMIEKDQDVIPKEVNIAASSTTAVSPPIITKVEITLAQKLAKLKSAKSKLVIQDPIHSTTTTAPSTIPKTKGITFRDAGESTTRTPTSISSSSIKDKGKAKMDEPKVPLKKKDQIALDEEMARNLEAQIQAKLIKEERLERKKEEEANIALIESWDNTQAMMEADFRLA